MVAYVSWKIFLFFCAVVAMAYKAGSISGRGH